MTENEKRLVDLLCTSRVASIEITSFDLNGEKCSLTSAISEAIVAVQMERATTANPEIEQQYRQAVREERKATKRRIELERHLPIGVMRQWQEEEWHKEDAKEDAHYRNLGRDK